jgi:hypothetical protein
MSLIDTNPETRAAAAVVRDLEARRAAIGAIIEERRAAVAAARTAHTVVTADPATHKTAAALAKALTELGEALLAMDDIEGLVSDAKVALGEAVEKVLDKHMGPIS